MENYLYNSLTLIGKYQELYKNGINIDVVIQKFKSLELLSNTHFDYARFRVFLNSCMLLFNKEKMNYFLNQEYSFKQFLEEANEDKYLMSYVNYIKENIIPDIDGVQLFYSYEKSNIKPWNQVAIIRNAMSHMQYGNFMHQNGCLLCYGLYNKDKGVRKDVGIVIEPIINFFVNKFFSNYNFEIPYKHTFFSYYSLSRKQLTKDMFFYTVTSKKVKDKISIYSGFNAHHMKEFANLFKNNNFIETLEKYRDRYNIEETSVNRLISMKKYSLTAHKRNLINGEDYIYGLKAILDLETEISNFLVHISKLNDLLYQYSLFCCNDLFSDKCKNKIFVELEELKEDKNAKLAFDIGFVYLKAMNFALRTEDDDFKKLEFATLNVSDFIYSDYAVKSYCERNNVLENGEQRYVIERIRNSLMHGNLKFDLSEDGDVYFIFVDHYNNREEVIKIILEKLDCFLSQNILYQDIPVETPILR